VSGPAQRTPQLLVNSARKLTTWRTPGDEQQNV